MNDLVRILDMISKLSSVYQTVENVDDYYSRITDMISNLSYVYHTKQSLDEWPLSKYKYNNQIRQRKDYKMTKRKYVMQQLISSI